MRTLIGRIIRRQNSGEKYRLIGTLSYRRASVREYCDPRYPFASFDLMRQRISPKRMISFAETPRARSSMLFQRALASNVLILPLSTCEEFRPKYSNGCVPRELANWRNSLYCLPMFLPPQSSERPPSSTVPMRPPIVLSRSTISESMPSCFRKKAAASPEAPPPTMIHRSICDINLPCCDFQTG